MPRNKKRNLSTIGNYGSYQNSNNGAGRTVKWSQDAERAKNAAEVFRALRQQPPAATPSAARPPPPPPPPRHLGNRDQQQRGRPFPCPPPPRPPPSAPPHAATATSGGWPGASAKPYQKLLWFAGQCWHPCKECADYDQLMEPSSLQAWIARAGLDLGILNPATCSPPRQLPHPLLWPQPNTAGFDVFFQLVKSQVHAYQLHVKPAAKRKKQTTTAKSRSPKRAADKKLSHQEPSKRAKTDHGEPKPAKNTPAVSTLPPRPSPSKTPPPVLTSSPGPHRSADDVPKATVNDTTAGPPRASAVVAAETVKTKMDLPDSPLSPDRPAAVLHEDSIPLSLPLPDVCVGPRLSPRSEDTWVLDVDKAGEDKFVHNGCCFPGDSALGCCQSLSLSGPGGHSPVPSPPSPWFDSAAVTVPGSPGPGPDSPRWRFEEEDSRLPAISESAPLKFLKALKGVDPSRGQLRVVISEVDEDGTWRGEAEAEQVNRAPTPTPALRADSETSERELARVPPVPPSPSLSSCGAKPSSTVHELRSKLISILRETKSSRKGTVGN